MKALFKRIVRWFKRPRYEYKEYTKVIWNWEKKPQAEIFAALHQELDFLKKSVPTGYQFERWSGPMQGKNKQLVYIMVFKRKIVKDEA